MINAIKQKLTQYQIIALTYLLIILVGAFLLTMPFSSKDGTFTPFINSLFTSTSALCVTGLIVYDTFTHWSNVGQVIILLLIQIGGIGFMTIMTALTLFLKRHLSLSEKCLFVQSTGNNEVGSTGKLVKQVTIGTVIIESIGVILLSIRFCPKFGFWNGLWNAVFHSISAFCNAGFDILGFMGEFGSLTAFSTDFIVNFTIMVLIVTGGLGFLVWSDLVKNKFNFKKLSLHSVLVLSTTTMLIVFGAVLFFVFERDTILPNMTFWQKIQTSLFMSITPRTAGFNTVDLNQMSNSGKVLTMVLMFIGGSSGSTAGGVKTTTFVVVLLTIVNHIRRKNTVTIGKRRLDDTAVYEASAIITMYLCAIVVSCLCIGAFQPEIEMQKIAYEVVSAVGTVGLSLGITTQLTVFSKIIIIVLMYGGRVGMLSLAMIFSKKNINVPLSRPVEKIFIG